MEIPFLGYAQDCIVSGTVTLREQRIADLIRDQPVIAVRDLEAESLADGHRAHHPALDLEWHEFVLVAATGPQGDPAHRFHATRRYPVHAEIGVYEIAGYIHAPVNVDPFAFARHKSVIALTDAAVSIRHHDRTEIHRHEAVLLNGAFRTYLASVADGLVQHLAQRAVEPVAAGRRWPLQLPAPRKVAGIRLGQPETATA